MKITKTQLIEAAKWIVLPVSVMLVWKGSTLAVKKYKEYKLKKSADKIFEEIKNENVENVSEINKDGK